MNAITEVRSHPPERPAGVRTGHGSPATQRRPRRYGTAHRHHAGRYSRRTPRLDRRDDLKRTRRLRRRRFVRLVVASCAFVVLIGTIAASNPALVSLPPPKRAAKAYASPSPAVLAAAAPPTASPTVEPTFAPEASVPPSPAPEPTPVEVPSAGPGSFRIVPGGTPVAGSGKLLRYTVELEEGLPFDLVSVAQTIDSTLSDSRSWISTGRHAFQRTDSEPDVRVVVATPDTTDRLCAPLKTRGEVSCHNGEFVVLNAKRWAIGVESYNGDIDNYRRYLINHEVGHALGHGHVPCPGAGELAPVMLQQTYGLDGCQPNAWPAEA